MSEASNQNARRPPRGNGRADAELYDYALDWYLTARDAACGYRSTLNGQIVVLERLGGSGGIPSSDLYNAGQVDVGPHFEGDFARDRKMLARWKKLSRQSQFTHVAYYLGRASGTKVDEAATDEEQLRVAAEQERIARRHGYSHDRKFPRGLQDLFHPFTGVVVSTAINGTQARLVQLGERNHENKLSPDDKNAAAKLKARAEHAVRAAHRAYFAVIEAELRGWLDEPGDWRKAWRRMRHERAERLLVAEPCPYPTRGKDGIWR